MRRFYEKIMKITINEKERQKRLIMHIEYIKRRIEYCAKESKRNYTYYPEDGIDISLITEVGKEFSKGGFLVEARSTYYGMALEISW